MKQQGAQSVYFLFVLLLLFSLGQTSCSSGNSSSSSDSVSISSLATIPNLDLSNVDSISTSRSTLFSRSSVSASEVGDNSIPGCEVVQFYQPMVLSRLKSAEVLKCFVQQTQEGAQGSSSPLEIPSGAYGYYQINLGNVDPFEEIEGSTEIRVRLGNFIQNGVNTFKMDVCESQNSVFSHSMELQITGNTNSKTWEGYIIDQIPEEGDFSRNNFSYIMNSASAMEENFSFDNINSAEAQSYSADNGDTQSPTANTNYEGMYLLTFAYDASNGRNIVTGSSNTPGTGNESLIYSIFNAVVGAAHSNISTEGIENYDGSEAFNPLTDPVLVISSSEVSFYDEVLAATLPELMTVAEMFAQTSFTDTWDCEAASGSSMTEIDGSGEDFDYNTCTQLMIEADEMGEADSSVCFQSVED